MNFDGDAVVALNRSAIESRDALLLLLSPDQHDKLYEHNSANDFEIMLANLSEDQRRDMEGLIDKGLLSANLLSGASMARSAGREEVDELICGSVIRMDSLFSAGNDNGLSIRWAHNEYRLHKDIELYFPFGLAGGGNFLLLKCNGGAVFYNFKLLADHNMSIASSSFCVANSLYEFLGLVREDVNPESDDR